MDTDKIDIRYKETCIVTTATGKEGYADACVVLRIPVDTDLAKELGLETYISRTKDPEAWGVEVAALNAAHKEIIGARRKNYNRKRPRHFRRHRSNRKKLISPRG